MAYEWGRFWYWVQQGGNSNIILVAATIVLVLITAWYAYITRGLLKVGQAQIREQVRPKLFFSLAHSGDLSSGELSIENVGGSAAQFLDITLRCYVGLKGPKLTLYLSQYQGAILEATTGLKVPFNFRPQLSVIPGIEHEGMTYMFFIVAADRSERVIQTYKYNPIINKMMLGHHTPLRILWQKRPSLWRPYLRLKDWAKW